MKIERIPIDPARDRQTWLALRQQDITASDIAAVCGEGMYGSPVKVWAEKRGLLPPQEMSEAMKRGLWGEAAVFEALAWEHPDWELRRAKVYLRDVEARIGATPDGAVVIPEREGLGVVQCKVVAKPIFVADWQVDPEDPAGIQFSEAKPPLGYELQTLTEAMLAEADYGVLAVLVVDTFKWALRVFFIERHATAEKAIRSRVEFFQKTYVDTGVQPPVDPERDGDLLRRLFPQDNGKEIDLSNDNRLPVLVDTREALKARMKSAKDDCDAIETEIKAKLGDCERARMIDGRIVSWKTQHRAEFVSPATSFRVLRLLKARKV